MDIEGADEWFCSLIRANSEAVRATKAAQANRQARAYRLHEAQEQRSEVQALLLALVIGDEPEW